MQALSKRYPGQVEAFSLCRRVRKLHFQLQVTIGSYGYEPSELYLVHGVLAFLALVVAHCIFTEVKNRPSSCLACSLRLVEESDVGSLMQVRRVTVWFWG